MNTKSYRKRREKILEGLGGKCESCGGTAFVGMEIHHRDGGGKDHRRKLRIARGVRNYKPDLLFRWVEIVGFEEAKKWLGLLCADCHDKHSLNGCRTWGLAFKGPMPEMVKGRRVWTKGPGKGRWGLREKVLKYRFSYPKAGGGVVVIGSVIESLRPVLVEMGFREQSIPRQFRHTPTL